MKRYRTHRSLALSPHCKHTEPRRMCRQEALFKEKKKEVENKETTHYWTPPSSDPVKEWESKRKSQWEREDTENKDYKTWDAELKRKVTLNEEGDTSHEFPLDEFLLRFTTHSKKQRLWQPQADFGRLTKDSGGSISRLTYRRWRRM